MLQRLRRLAPELSHMTDLDGTPIFVTMDGVVGVALSMDCLDVETGDPSGKVRLLLQLLRALPEQVRLRINLKCEAANSLPYDHPRAHAIQDKGFLKERLTIILEKKDRSLSTPTFREALQGGDNQSRYLARLREMMERLPIQSLRDLGATPLGKEEVIHLFDLGRSEIADHWKFIETATDRIGVIRLEKQVATDNDAGDERWLDENTLASLKKRLPLPFEISVTLKKKSKKDSHTQLKRKLAQKSGSSDVMAEPQAAAAREALERTVLGSTSVVEMEWLFILRRADASQLSQAVQIAERELGVLGDVVLETVGKLPSFVATLPGSDAHYPIDEYDEGAWAFLPVFSFGESLPRLLAAPHRTLVLHREDDSLFFFDPFARHYQGCNIVVNGIRGSGKSLLGNLTLEALSKEPRVRVLQFDVGGSYLKHCSKFGGKLIQATMDRPSGINAFKILTKMPESNDVIRTLSGFLAPLMVDRHEKELPAMEEAGLEHAIKAYGASRPNQPSLSDFLSRNYEIPRKTLLLRWTEGIYENVFKEDPEAQCDPGAKESWYTYFNLEHIHNAANPDYVKGVFGAIIARANIAMLEAGDARTGNGDILVLYSDESSFLTDLYFSYAKFTTANFRKFGHGTIFIAQQFKSFERVTSDGGIDRGVIENSPIRFIFQVEGTDEEFARNYELTPAQVARVRNLYRGREYRECLIQTPSSSAGKEARVVKINVTPEEYWEATSDKSDNQKLYGLMKAVPGLKLQEAIACLSLGREPVL